MILVHLQPVRDTRLYYWVLLYNVVQFFKFSLSVDFIQGSELLRIATMLQEANVISKNLGKSFVSLLHLLCHWLIVMSVEF